jgi:hypothetical protein
MQSRLKFCTLVACLVAHGCATPRQDDKASVAPVAPPQSQDRYVTGSRIPIRDDGAGSSTVGTSSKADLEEEMRRMTPGSHGQ